MLGLPLILLLRIGGVLRALARGGPVLVAVDHRHWLDEPTRAVTRRVPRRPHRHTVRT
jgi:hypothetical protein